MLSIIFDTSDIELSPDALMPRDAPCRLFTPLMLFTPRLLR